MDTEIVAMAARIDALNHVVAFIAGSYLADLPQDKRAQRRQIIANPAEIPRGPALAKLHKEIATWAASRDDF